MAFLSFFFFFLVCLTLQRYQFCRRLTSHSLHPVRSGSLPPTAGIQLSDDSENAYLYVESKTGETGGRKRRNKMMDYDEN